ncbi:uncharacterized protein LOC132200530 [Neocloeon triangulifer]|uniref:uncharacterized protein LOC132200530 n=1 Tax=Neocloeon triangulifer TaxID=2078957 RepID=UPI00286F449F|nr:uncharacterized protein LOC132200530 [Neocloeon triangulifer]
MESAAAEIATPVVKGGDKRKKNLKDRKDEDEQRIHRKLEALEKGEGTDCVFLVGSDENTAQTFHALKIDLFAGSEYFRRLLESPLTPTEGPIRLKLTEPHFFKMVMEHVHVYRLQTKVVNLDDAVGLALVADEFMIEELGVQSAVFVFKFLSPRTVWELFEKFAINKYIVSACKKFLCLRTRECFYADQFLEIQLETLVSFLAIEEQMSIKSEDELVNACVKLALSKNGEIETRSIIRAVIPHLRLQTLDEDDLVPLSQWLTLEEKIFLTLKKHKLPLLFETKPSKPPTICSIKVPRTSMKTLTLIPESVLLSNSAKDCLRSGKFRQIKAGEKFILSFEAKQTVIIHGFDVITPLFHFSKERWEADTSCIGNEKTPYNDISWRAKIAVSNKEMDFEETFENLGREYAYEGKFFTNSWMHFDYPVIVVKGSTFSLSILPTEREGICLREVLGNFVFNEILEWNDSTIVEPFQNFHICQLRKVYQPDHARINNSSMHEVELSDIENMQEEPSANPICIVKDIFYHVV